MVRVLLENWQMESVAIFFLVLKECYFATCCAALNPTVSNVRGWSS